MSTDTTSSGAAGISVSVPSSATTRQRSCAGYGSTSSIAPSARPDSVVTWKPSTWWDHHCPSGSSGSQDSGIRSSVPATASAAVRSPISSNVTSRRSPCGRAERTVYVRPLASNRTEPGNQRSGLSERFCTESSPRTPWGLAIRPTVTVGSSTSVLEVDAGGQVLARGRCANDRTDRLGGAAAATDHLAELAGADRDAVRGTAVVEGLGDAHGVGVVD